MRHRRLTRARRGQTLALFALTLLLLTLMVALTLAISTKAKEKMELQQVTDAAAYSQAVTVARSLNGVAVLNRAEVSIMVTLAATQSLISWSSVYMASLNALRTSIAQTKDQRCDPPGPGCSGACARLGALSAAITAEYQTVFTQNYLTGGLADGDAGREALAIQGAAGSLWALQQRMYHSMVGKGGYPGLIKDQRLTRAIVDRARQGARYPAEYEVDPAGDLISLRELNSEDTFGGAGSGAMVFAVDPRNRSSEIAVKAATGTRGNPFVRNRSEGGPIQTRLQSRLALDVGGGESFTVTTAGAGYWVDQPPAAHDVTGQSPYATYAEDEGSITGVVGTATCKLSLVPSAIEARVIGDDRTVSRDDDHSWTGGADGENARQPDHPHTLGPCDPDRCPGLWTMFIDLNPDIVGDRVDHLHGQPKTMAIVRRNLLKRCEDTEDPGVCAGVDPWNLLFRFRFTPTGEDFDARGLYLGSGADVSTPVAMATGLTYYHRPGHWREPPNFFNPFWRATLVSTAVDRQGDPVRNGTDLEQLLDAAGGPSSTTAKSVIQQLDAAGFRGWQ